MLHLHLQILLASFLGLIAFVAVLNIFRVPLTSLTFPLIVPPFVLFYLYATFLLELYVVNFYWRIAPLYQGIRWIVCLLLFLYIPILMGEKISKKRKQ